MQENPTIQPDDFANTEAVIAELRKTLCTQSYYDIENDIESGKVDSLIDCLEKVWKRERESLAPQPDTDWKGICVKCMDGEIEPDCEYYGEPNGCNSPLYGQHPKQIPSCSPNCSIKQKVLTLDEAIAHAEECVDESPCGQNHRQLADWLKELKELKVGGDAAAMREALEKIAHYDENDHGMDDPYCADGHICADIARKALSAPPRNCDAFSKAEVLEVLDDRSFSKEDTVEWLYSAKGETDGGK